VDGAASAARPWWSPLCRSFANLVGPRRSTRSNRRQAHRVGEQDLSPRTGNRQRSIAPPERRSPGGPHPGSWRPVARSDGVEKQRRDSYQTAFRTAVPWILLTRKRTEVQLLPRPPHGYEQGFWLLLAQRWMASVGKEAFSGRESVLLLNRDVHLTRRVKAVRSHPCRLVSARTVIRGPSRPAARDALGSHRSEADGRSGRGRRRIPRRQEGRGAGWRRSGPARGATSIIWSRRPPVDGPRGRPPGRTVRAARRLLPTARRCRKP
jgi:hypothetical protein